MSRPYGQEPADFTPGQRVALHQITELWMQAGRYGTVTQTDPTHVHIRFDVVDEIHRLLPRELRALPRQEGHQP